jgi:hypothetical protein
MYSNASSAARIEALGVKQLLGETSTVWVLVGASPTALTSNGQPGVEDFQSR